MVRKAEALCHGAATIVNAMALGKGAAFGVDLWTKARVELTNEPGVIEGEISNDPNESTMLIERAVARVLGHFKVHGDLGAHVKTWSNIPIAKGLKSSSVAANAVVLAASAALGETLEDVTIVSLGVDAAFDAKVTVTGAFDDACAAYFGDTVITDNEKRRIIKQCKLPAKVSVLFLVPPSKAYSGSSDLKKIRTMKPLVKIAFEEALKGNFWDALTLNGLIYSSILGFESKVVSDALQAGALAAGLCGKGPAVTVVVPKDGVDIVKSALKVHPGDILESCLNSEKAKVL